MGYVVVEKGCMMRGCLIVLSVGRSVVVVNLMINV